MSRTICDGLTVIELGAGSIAASLAGMLLADNGARVLKVEPPEGDRLRAGMPSGFLVWNRGKESIVLDLHTDSGREEVRDLASRADVLVEGFGEGVAETWGLAYKRLRTENPALVYASIKGFGSTGAYAKLKAYEGIVAAKAGVFGRGMFGFRSGPIFSGVPLASNGAGHMALAGILAALMVREQTGRGQKVEATMLQGLNPMDYFGTMTWQYTQRMAKTGQTAAGMGGLAASRYNVLLCAQDGRWVNFCPQLAHQAHALLRVLGLEKTLEDPRFVKAPSFANVDDAQAWENLLWEAFRTKTLAEWVPILLSDPDIPFEPAGTSEEGLDHPQAQHNGEVIEVDDPELGKIREVGPIAAFARSPSVIERSAPALGAHGGPLAGPLVPDARGAAPACSLAGVTIIEFGYFYAMPFGVALAGSLGARVIKIEDSRGDPMRLAFGPPQVGAAKTTEGKESLALNLKTPEGQKIVHELVANADAFVLGFRPGVAERLNVDYPTLSRINPRLVYLHASGYGVSGPYGHRPNYAMVASAFAGSYHRQAGEWLDPKMSEGLSVMELREVIAPRLRPPTDGDSNAALAVFSSLLLALAHQRRAGEGQFISTTMIGGNAYGYADDFNSYKGKPPVALSDRDQYGLHALYRLYPARSGWVFLAAPTQSEWEALADGIERPDLKDDGRFRTLDARRTNDGDLIRVLRECLSARAAAEWEELLTSRGVGCVEVFEQGTSTFTNTDPVLKETGLVAEVDHPLFGRILRHGLPVEMSETPGRIAPGCLPGQHTDQIARELGYSAQQIRDMKQDGILFTLD